MGSASPGVLYGRRFDPRPDGRMAAASVRFFPPVAARSSRGGNCRFRHYVRGRDGEATTTRRLADDRGAVRGGTRAAPPAGGPSLRALISKVQEPPRPTAHRSGETSP